MAGRCLIELSQPAQAEPLLSRALECYNTAHVREVALYQAWQAEGYARSGELDAGRVTLESGQGEIIMRNMGDAPRLNALYGQGEWVKIQYVLRGIDSTVAVYHFRNLDTGLDVEFKPK